MLYLFITAFGKTTKYLLFCTVPINGLWDNVYLEGGGYLWLGGTLMHHVEQSLCYLVSASLIFYVLWTKQLSASRLTHSIWYSLS